MARPDVARGDRIDRRTVCRWNSRLPIPTHSQRRHYQFITTFFLTFGVAYPVLRHRLVDLDVIVTRATVFGVVSVIIVGLFVVVAAEWVIARVFEQSSQIVTLLFVLVLGISARWIHRFVDEYCRDIFPQAPARDR
ncbi:MAG TPA: hypothetical protein VKX96_16550 [Chloroflexota bacterium]|nr:hypothetical protein [Chloroflexota bacterium]